MGQSQRRACFFGGEAGRVFGIGEGGIASELDFAAELSKGIAFRTTNFAGTLFGKFSGYILICVSMNLA